MSDMANLTGRKIIPLDDIRAEFKSKIKTDTYVVENDPVLTETVGKFKDESNFNELEETMYTLENSIASITPKVPIVPAGKLEKIKLSARKKMKEKTTREELKDIKFDVKPELANLENTIILNAEVLRQGLIHTEKKKNESKGNKIGLTIVIVLFSLLVLFALSIPFIINYLWFFVK